MKKLKMTTLPLADLLKRLGTCQVLDIAHTIPEILIHVNKFYQKLSEAWIQPFIIQMDRGSLQGTRKFVQFTSHSSFPWHIHSKLSWH